MYPYEVFMSIIRTISNVFLLFCIVTGARIQIAVSRDGLDCSLYVNGQLSVHSASSVSLAYLNSNLVFGADYQNLSNYFTGTMENVAFYSQSLTESQVNALYESTVIVFPSASPSPLPSTTIPNTIPTARPMISNTTVTLPPVQITPSTTICGRRSDSCESICIIQIVVPIVAAFLIGLCACGVAYRIYHLEKDDRYKWSQSIGPAANTTNYSGLNYTQKP